jgi:hypothetical protein
MLGCLFRPLVMGLIAAAGVFWWNSNKSGIDFMSALYQVNHECLWNSPLTQAALAGMVVFVLASCMSSEVRRVAMPSFAASLADYDLMDART